MCDMPHTRSDELSAYGVAMTMPAPCTEDEAVRRRKQMAAMYGSLGLEGKAIALLCRLAQQRPQYPPNTPTSARPLTTHCAAGHGHASPGSRAESPQHTLSFSYAYLKSARNHMSTRAAMCLTAVVALAHSDRELDVQLRAGSGSEIVHQLWRLKEWEEARDCGGSSELGQFDGKRPLLVALANLGLRCSRV